jgi:guanyl-specific ribonuclease Sa
VDEWVVSDVTGETRSLGKAVFTEYQSNRRKLTTCAGETSTTSNSWHIICSLAWRKPGVDTMRIPVSRGIELSAILTAVVLAWLQVGCSPSPPEGVQVAPTAPQSSDIEPLTAHHRPPATAHHTLPSGVPAKVATVLHHIDTTHRAPDGYEGGRSFHNEGHGGEQRLPHKDKEGKAISYQEWDVNPKVHNVNRGAERLVTGSDGSAYYTTDHYRTFTKVR